MAQRVEISQLASPCMARRRGEEAYEALVTYLRKGPVDILLDGVGIVSTSFLDALVCNLSRAGQTDAVSFVSGDPSILDKLARISGARSVTISARSANGKRYRVTPMMSTEYKPEFVTDKIYAD